MFDGKYFDWNQKRAKGIVDYYGYKFFYGKKTVDLGCGHADISGVLYRLGSDITAVDARQEHLKVASKKFPGIKVVKGNLDGVWPFHGQKFDMTLDLGLLCHLASFENHLRAVCTSTTYLVLETAVCDSDDPYKCIQVPEGKEVYDLSYNGMGCRPSAAAIERVLAECHMSFKRVDNAKFNSGEYVYDWIPKNDDSTSIYNRRIWFCTKNPVGYTLPESAGQPVVVMQPAESTSPYVHFSTNGVPLILTAPPPPIVMTASPKPPMMAASGPILGIRETSKKYALLPGKPVPQFPNLKVLYLPLNDGPNTQQGMYDAWKNVGVELQIFDYHRQWQQTKNRSRLQSDLIAMVKNFQPHLMHMQLQFTGLIDPHVLQECRRICPGVIITNWSGDVRKHAVPEFIQLANIVDYSLISSTGQLDMYRNAGCHNIKYWQIGYDPSSNYPMHNKTFQFDACFLGNNYGHTFTDGPLRERVVNRMHQVFGARFGLFGHGYPGLNRGKTCAYQDANKYYNDSICTLSISNFNNISHYFSDRLLHCLASGRPTISWHFPGCEDYFENGSEVFFVKSDQEAIDIVNQMKTNPDLANRIGENGYQRALREHTYTSRVLELIDMVVPETKSSTASEVVTI